MGDAAQKIGTFQAIVTHLGYSATVLIRNVWQRSVTTRESIIPSGLENLYTEKGYAPGVRVGNMLYVSGMLGRDGALRVIEDPEAQFVQVFENTAMVLAAANATFADVIEFVGYFTWLRRDFAFTLKSVSLPRTFAVTFHSCPATMVFIL